MKRSQPRRIWDDARAKVNDDPYCRVCGQFGVECAHIVGRRHDKPRPGSHTLYVHPDSIVGLCPKHHRAYDAHALDLLGHLTPEEEARAVLDAGGLENARRRLAPSCYRSGREAAA